MRFVVATSVRIFSAPATEWIIAGSLALVAVRVARSRKSMALLIAVGSLSAQSRSAIAFFSVTAVANLSFDDNEARQRWIDRFDTPYFFDVAASPAMTASATMHATFSELIDDGMSLRTALSAVPASRRRFESLGLGLHRLARHPIRVAASEQEGHTRLFGLCSYCDRNVVAGHVRSH